MSLYCWNVHSIKSCWCTDLLCVCLFSVCRAAGAISVRVQQRWWGCYGSWFRARASCQSTAGAACWAVGKRLLCLHPPPPALQPAYCHSCAKGKRHWGMFKYSHIPTGFICHCWTRDCTTEWKLLSLYARRLKTMGLFHTHADLVCLKTSPQRGRNLLFY